MNFNRPLTLASKSPRRKFLLESCGFKFKTVSIDADESYGPNIANYDVARFLAQKKANYYDFTEPDEVVITADTVVIFQNRILGKPGSKDEAVKMLSRLAGNTHEVVTGVCIGDEVQQRVFDDLTSVTFRKFSREEIEYYVDNFDPYDKAGSYGAQDWWGLVGIEKLVGSYFNVMGLPTHKLYDELMSFK